LEDKIKEIGEKALKEYRSGNLESAKSLFEEVVAIDKNHYQSLYNLGIICFNQDQNTEAENYLNRSFKLNKSDKYFSSVIDIYIVQNKTEKAEQILLENKNNFEESIINLNNKKILRQKRLSQLIFTYNNLNKEILNKDLLTFKEYTKSHKKDYMGWKLLGSVYLKILDKDENDKKNLNNARNAFERSYKYYNRDIDVILSLGSLYNRVREYDKALSLYSISKKIFPDNSSLYFNSSNIYVKLSEFEKAKKELHKALEINPQSYKYLQNLAKVCKDLNENENAFILYERMVKLEPENAIGYRGLGAINIILGNLVDAKNLIEKSLKIEPDNEDASQNLSICYFRMGKSNEGMKLMKKQAGVISFTLDKREGSFQIKED